MHVVPPHFLVDYFSGAFSRSGRGHFCRLFQGFLSLFSSLPDTDFYIYTLLFHLKYHFCYNVSFNFLLAVDIGCLDSTCVKMLHWISVHEFPAVVIRLAGIRVTFFFYYKIYFFTWSYLIERTTFEMMITRDAVSKFFLPWTVSNRGILQREMMTTERIYECPPARCSPGFIAGDFGGWSVRGYMVSCFWSLFFQNRWIWHSCRPTNEHVWIDFPKNKQWVLALCLHFIQRALRVGLIRRGRRVDVFAHMYMTCTWVCIVMQDNDDESKFLSSTLCQ